MWKAESFFENAWRPLSGLVEITGRAPSTSVVREIARSSFPNAPNFLRHLDNEMEAAPADFMADGRRDAIELWANSAGEQSLRFDWALPHKIISIGDALALYSLDAIEQQPLTVAWHDRTAVIIPLTGEEQQVTIEYQPNLQDDARVNQMRHRHASQSHQLETILDWRGYFGRESAIIDGWTTMYRRGKKWVVTLRGKAGYLVGYVLQRITKVAPTPTLTSDPLAQIRLIQMGERYPHIANTYPDLSTIDAVKLEQAIVFVHGTLSCGIQSLKDLYPHAIPSPLFRFEHDTFQPIKQNSDRLVQLIEEKLMCRKLVLVAHSRGGLVAKWARQQLRQSLIPDNMKLYTFGTPHRGTPLVNIGARLLNQLWKLGEDITSGVPMLAPIVKAYSVLANEPELPPGIQVMKEGSETLEVLNSLADDGSILCWGSRFDENSRVSGFGVEVTGILQGALNGMDHDLVVPTASALGYGTPQPTLRCSHVNYFSDPMIQPAIQNCFYP